MALHYWKRRLWSVMNDHLERSRGRHLSSCCIVLLEGKDGDNDHEMLLHFRHAEFLLPDSDTRITVFTKSL